MLLSISNVKIPVEHLAPTRRREFFILSGAVDLLVIINDAIEQST